MTENTAADRRKDPAMIGQPEDILIEPAPPQEIEPPVSAVDPLPIPNTFEILKLLWERRSLIFRVTLISGLVWLGIAFLIPKEYEATTRLMPPGSTSGATALMGAAMSSGAEGSGGGAGSMLGGMGGLGNLFGK